jgi:hypothetical protein
MSKKITQLVSKDRLAFLRISLRFKLGASGPALPTDVCGITDFRITKLTIQGATSRLFR